MNVAAPLAFLNFHGPEGGSWRFLVVIVVIILGPFLAERVRLPGIIGLLAGGLIIGPHLLGVIAEDDTTIHALGDFGLLYLMFLAGVELDLEIFRRNRNAAITFALLTFGFPMVFGTIGGFALGFGVSAALLLGSLLASHTLVSYPTARRFGLAANPAVATTVGATVITDTLALAVLAGVSGAATGDAGGAELAAQLVVGLALLAGWCFLVLPRIGRWFFMGIGQERTLRFVFILAGFLSGAVLAEMVGIDGIVGAFFAGLALNRLVPNASALMDRIGFFGSALFIPLFLVSVGLIIEPAVMVDPETLGYALVFIVACGAGKFVAAAFTKPLFHFSWDEVLVMFGLSLAQAAATLAATVIGFEIGLFGETVVNAVLWLIVVSLIVSSLATARAARRMKPAADTDDRLGRSIVLPLFGLERLPTIARLAGRLAEIDGGVVVPVRVSDVADSDHTDDRALMSAAAGTIGAAGMDVEVLFRVDTSIESGIAHVCRSEQASMLVLEAAPGESTGLGRASRLVFGSETDQMAAASPVPVLLVRADELPIDRVVLVLTDRDLSGQEHAVALGTDLAGRLRRSGLGVTILVSSRAAAGSLLDGSGDVEIVETPDPLAGSRQHARPGTLILLLARPGRSLSGHDAVRLGNLPGVSLGIVAAARATQTAASSADGAMKLIVGRSA